MMFHLIRAAALSLILLTGAALATPADSTNRTISEVLFYGNRHSRDRLLRMFLDLDSGDVYDSAAAAQAKERLLSSDLFERVEIFPVFYEAGVRLQVVLIERPYLSLSDIGGDLMNRYGKTGSNLWERGRVRLGVSYVNFRGLKEKLTVRISLIEWRSLSVGWGKPFLGTPWSLSLGGSVSDNPSTSVPLRTQAGSLSISGGRRLLTYGSVFASIAPAVNNTQFIDRENQWILYYQVNPDSVDTARSIIDTYRFPYDNRTFVETVLSAGVSVDRRDNGFDPKGGFSVSLQGRTNPLWPGDEIYRENKYYRDSTRYGVEEDTILRQNGRTFDPADSLELLARRYFQIDAQARWYHRGFWDGDVFAYRARLTLRNREGGLLNRVSAGGESTLRGFSGGAVNNNNRANNLFAGSVEYRSTIWSTPSSDMFTFLDLRRFGYDLRGIYYRLDGAVFFDGAFLWDTWSEPLHPVEGHQKAWSAGIGLRVVAPTLRHTLAFDLSPLVYDPWDDELVWGWRWNLYLDLHF